MKFPEIDQLRQIKLVFLTGIGRSGTTLLTSILHSHSKVIATPENNFLLFSSRFFRKDQLLTKSDYDLLVRLNSYHHNHETSIWGFSNGDILSIYSYYGEKLTFQDFIRLMYLYYDRSKNPEEVELIVDKNPIYTCFTDKIKRIIPEALFISITRNPVANVASRLKHKKKKRSSVRQLSLSWNHYNEIIASERSGDRFHSLRYEDLIQDPRKVIQGLCSFLSLSFEEDMLHPEKSSAGLLQKASEKLDEESMKKVYSMHKNLESGISASVGSLHSEKLSEYEKKLILGICKTVAEKFDYPVTVNSLKYPLEQLRYKLAFSIFTYIYYKSPLWVRSIFLKRKNEL